jgi:hypothetical protein
MLLATKFSPGAIFLGQKLKSRENLLKTEDQILGNIHIFGLIRRHCSPESILLHVNTCEISVICVGAQKAYQTFFRKSSSVSNSVLHKHVNHRRAYSFPQEFLSVKIQVPRSVALVAEFRYFVQACQVQTIGSKHIHECATRTMFALCDIVKQPKIILLCEEIQ